MRCINAITGGKAEQETLYKRFISDKESRVSPRNKNAQSGVYDNDYDIWA